eukprot:660306-Pleurochrysis_carterae.AAC.3
MSNKKHVALAVSSDDEVCSVVAMLRHVFNGVAPTSSWKWDETRHCENWRAHFAFYKAIGFVRLQITYDVRLNYAVSKTMVTSDTISTMLTYDCLCDDSCVHACMHVRARLAHVWAAMGFHMRRDVLAPDCPRASCKAPS